MMKMQQNKSVFFRLEDRVLFEAAAAEAAVAADQIAEQAAEAAADAEAGEADQNEESESAGFAAAVNSAEFTGIGNAGEENTSGPVETLTFAESPVAEQDAPATMTIDLLANDNVNLSTGKELVVINSSVYDKDAILASLAPGQEVLMLSPDSDAMSQIFDRMESAGTKYDALHIVTHGNEGYFLLNSSSVDAENFDAAQWKAIGEHLTADADIMIYGCELAANEAGQGLCSMIAEASGADVAASTDTTGIGGDWDLEYTVGSVEADTITVENFNARLYDIQVTEGTDAALRKAITDAAAGDSISFDAALKGTTITLDSALTIKVSLTIDGDVDGDGVADITLSGNDANRIFVINTTESVTLKNLNITNGYCVGNGGALFAQSQGADLTFSNLHFSNNETAPLVDAEGNITTYYKGGAIYLQHSQNVVIRDCTFTDNYNSGEGGAIYITSSKANAIVLLDGNLFDGNSAGTAEVMQNCGAAGVDLTGAGATVQLKDNTFTDNTAYNSHAAGSFKAAGGIVLQGTNIFRGNTRPTQPEGTEITFVPGSIVQFSSAVEMEKNAILKVTENTYEFTTSCAAWSTVNKTFEGFAVRFAGTLHMNEGAELHVTDNSFNVKYTGTTTLVRSAVMKGTMFAGGAMTMENALLDVSRNSISLETAGTAGFGFHANIYGAGLNVNTSLTAENSTLTFKDNTAYAYSAVGNSWAVGGGIFQTSGSSLDTNYIKISGGFLEISGNTVTAGTETGKDCNARGAGIGNYSAVSQATLHLIADEKSPYLFKNNKMICVGTMAGTDIYQYGKADQPRDIKLVNVNFVSAANYEM